MSLQELKQHKLVISLAILVQLDSNNEGTVMALLRDLVGHRSWSNYARDNGTYGRCRTWLAA